MTDTPDAERPDVTGVLRDLAWSIHRRVPAPAGLDPLPTTELALLKHVLDSPGIRVSELARHLGLRQSNTSSAVRTLVERGLIARESSAADRRVSSLVPTGKALAADTAISDAWSGSIRAGLAQLPPGQVAVIEAAAEALRRLDLVLRAE